VLPAGQHLQRFRVTSPGEIDPRRVPFVVVTVSRAALLALGGA
jgi:hypothetical protein